MTGPLSFLIFINYISSANDAILFYTSSVVDNFANAQADINMITRWIECNSLKLNEKNAIICVQIPKTTMISIICLLKILILNRY